ncbi:hypothetical protein P692DRAFT_20948820 [Suillus brevipes Sb2]|nr:hypothetical protein P692DRAFT_20948820 [Suillus brevipes Sb2]
MCSSASSHASSVLRTSHHPSRSSRQPTLLLTVLKDVCSRFTTIIGAYSFGTSLYPETKGIPLSRRRHQRHVHRLRYYIYPHISPAYPYPPHLRIFLRARHSKS